MIRQITLRRISLDANFNIWVILSRIWGCAWLHRRVFDWWPDLLYTYTILILYWPLYNTLCLLSSSSSTAVSRGSLYYNSSHSHSYIAMTFSQSVSQSVLVPSPIWYSWPDVYYCLTFTFLSLWGALSDEMTGLSFVRVRLSPILVLFWVRV
jgi:hypothetical protein